MCVRVSAYVCVCVCVSLCVCVSRDSPPTRRVGPDQGGVSIPPLDIPCPCSMYTSRALPTGISLVLFIDGRHGRRQGRGYFNPLAGARALYRPPSSPPPPVFPLVLFVDGGHGSSTPPQ